MPDVILRDGATMEDTVAMLKKTLSWLMANLDHDNVKRLYTEFCQIQSQNGETQIDGPLLMMYDKQDPPVLRLKMGYDSSSNKFIFEMYDAAGNLTLSENDTGEAVFAGNISTAKDAVVGNNLYVGDVDSGEGLKALGFFKIDAAWKAVILVQCLAGQYLMNISAANSITIQAPSISFSGTVSGLEASGYAKTDAIQNWVTTNFVHK